jgi:hypothetical protein
MPSGIYWCAITIWRHLKASLRPQFPFEKADITYIYIWKACREFRYKINRTEDVLFQLKIRGASEKFKNQPRPLLRPRSINFCQQFWNLSRKTVPLNKGTLRYIKYSFGPYLQRLLESELAWEEAWPSVDSCPPGPQVTTLWAKK